jgi:cytochrome P450
MTGSDLDQPQLLPTRRDPGSPFAPPPGLAQRHAAAPVTPLAFPDGHVGWLVTGHDLARVVLSDPRFSTRPDRLHSPLPRPNVRPGGAAAAPAPGWFPNMDPPEHTRYRRALIGRFTVRRMRQLEPRIAEIVEARLAAMEVAGPPVDLVAGFALPVPSLVICELLGVPYADHAFFEEQSTVLVDIGSTEAQAVAALGNLAGYLRELVAGKRAAPSDDLLGGLVAAGGLTDEELANIALVLLVAGHETTANMLALGAFALLRHPEQLAALRADPELTAPAVEELMRYLTVISSAGPRAATEDVRLGDVLVRQGETVVVALPAVNRDPGRFPDPDVLRLDRAEARHHLGFGHGVHQCLGQQLARIEMRIGLGALVDRFPGLRLAVAPEAVPVREQAMVHGVRRLPVAWDRR